jgi:trimeric autotransporter adhesin
VDITDIILENYLFITYERALFTQAKVRKFLILTNERKKMSTKTTFKRVALIAVVALGLGGLSTVSANAAPASAWTVGTAATDTTAITLAQATSSPAAGTSVTVNFGAAVGTVAGGADATHGIYATYTGFISAYPSGGFAQATAVATASTTTTAVTGATTTAATNTITLKETTATAGITATTVKATSAAGIGSFTFTPQVAGTYTLKVWNDAGTPDATIGYNEAVQTIDIVVAARSAASAALSTAYMASAILPSAGTYAPSSTTDVTIAKYQPVLCLKSASAAQCANILVTAKNASNAAIGTGYTFAAEISGSGNLGITDTDNSYTAAATARSVSLTTSTDGIFNVSVWPDGTGGKGTVTITATDADGVKTVLATKSVSFYGTVATLAVVADSQNYSILKAAKGTATGIKTGLTATSDVPALTLVAKDSNGILVPGLTISGKSSDIAVVSASTADEDLVAADVGYLYGGQGYYNADATSAAASVSGAKATVTYSTTLADGVTKISTTANYSIGGSVAKEVIALDKTSYQPGDGMVVTITGTDSAGNPVYDGAASPAVAFSKAVGGTAPAASTYLAGKVSSSTTKVVYTVFAPVVSGPFTAQITSGATGNPVVTTSSTVGTGSTEAAANAATDAANEATDAANAATDAALAAADAADAATAAAQDASDAVAALSATVATLVASLKAQITSLTNLVIKIQKKVKA